MHFAKRELQRMTNSRAVHIGLVTVGIIAGITGPFGTEDVMRLLPRIIYWVGVVALTFLTGTFVSSYFEALLNKHSAPFWISSGLCGGAIAAVVCVQVFGLNWALFGLSPFVEDYAAPLALNIFVLSIIINVATNLILDLMAERNTVAIEQAITAPAPINAQSPPRTSEILRRLPFDKRGDLISMSVSDHYVEVATNKGRELILIRLADAITMAGEGLQVHRSHWVAKSHIASVKRLGPKAVIKTSDGRDIPVSRTYVPVLKEAGYLP